MHFPFYYPICIILCNGIINLFYATSKAYFKRRKGRGEGKAPQLSNVCIILNWEKSREERELYILSGCNMKAKMFMSYCSRLFLSLLPTSSFLPQGRFPQLNHFKPNIWGEFYIWIIFWLKTCNLFPEEEAGGNRKERS